MCKKMEHTEFRQFISVKCGQSHRASNVIEFLKMTGLAMDDKGAVELDDYFDTFLDRMISPIQTGDIVFVFTAGFHLVTDIHPSAMNDGKHFRALAVTMGPDGECTIKADRSQIFSNFDAIRVRTSTFNMEEVERCSKSRHDAYVEIERINAVLTTLQEQEQKG